MVDYLAVTGDAQPLDQLQAAEALPLVKCIRFSKKLLTSSKYSICSLFFGCVLRPLCYGAEACTNVKARSHCACVPQSGMACLLCGGRHL